MRLTLKSQVLPIMVVCLSSIFLGCGGSQATDLGTNTQASTATSSQQTELNNLLASAKNSQVPVSANSAAFTVSQLESQISFIEDLLAKINAFDPTGLPQSLATERTQVILDLTSLLTLLNGELAQVQALPPPLPCVQVIAGFLGINSSGNTCPPPPCVKVIAGFLGIVPPANCPTTP